MSSPVYITVLLYLLEVSVCGASNNKSNVTDLHQATSGRTPENVVGCGEVHIEKQFTLKSPNYPENYAANLDCHYLLKGPHCPTYYQFDFLNFSLANSENCAEDRFVVGDQDVLCGNRNRTKAYFAANGSLHVRFKTSEGTSGGGYLIKVTRRACEKIAKSVTEKTTIRNESRNSTHENSKNTVPRIDSRLLLPNDEEKKPHCCGTIYNSKRFLITSPNFPRTLNKITECSFEIHKANDNICRLRLNFLFFWIGFTDRNNCPYGYLEIDGKYVCGCNNDLKLTTAFGSSNVKVLKFKTEPHHQSYNSGFVVEVIQEDCPKKYSPEATEKFSSNNSNPYGIYNDQINRVAWPRDAQNLIEKLQLINERTEILDDDSVVFHRTNPKIIKSIYVFAPPEYPSLYLDQEQTTYLDLSNVNSVLTNNNYFQCLDWNQRQYRNLNGRFGKTLTCPRNDENAPSSMKKKECVDLSYVNGYLRSPGYPCYYPENLNICYRLRKRPGYCTIKVFIQDFQIENSFNCVKDYFLLANGEKHCGNSLYKASWIIDLRNKDFEDMIFVTDDYYCARGFSGVYQQIACQDELPAHPVDTTTSPIIPTTPAHDYCNKIIKEKSFTMEMNEDREMCTFSIQKYEKDVCKINFRFEKFDLVCGVESLLIDGTMYCGHLSGRVVKVNVNNASTDIVFRSTLERKYEDLRFKIKGEQISDDCLFIGEPEVQRLVKIKPEAIKQGSNLPTEDLELQDNSKYLIAFVNKKFKDICAIVTNPKTKELPSSFCEILTKDHNATKCVPLQKKNLTNVPYETKKLGVELQNRKTIKEIQELEIHEIDCDNLHV